MEKKRYIAPEIEIVKLDSEISLALESNPMEGPFEVMLLESNKGRDPLNQQG